jgi:hypothetical protein
MSNTRIDRNVFTDASWWHWLLTIPLLVVSLAGYSWAIVATMVLCAVAAGYFLLRLRRLQPFPVQVRIAYLGLLAVGTLPWMQWIHWVQLAGTTAMVTVGYCPLMRMLHLAPFNRAEPLTGSLIWRIFFQEPCGGGLVCWPAPAQESAFASCSLPAPSR